MAHPISEPHPGISVFPMIHVLESFGRYSKVLVEHIPPKMKVAFCVVTAECQILSSFRVLWSFQVPWYNWRHFRKLFTPPHNKMVPLLRTIDAIHTFSGKFGSFLVLRSPLITSEAEIPPPNLSLIPPTISKQENLSEKCNWLIQLGSQIRFTIRKTA